MLTGLYSAGTAMESASRQHEVIAQNLAHAQMPGYRRMMIRNASFESGFDEELRVAVQRQALGTDSQEIVFDFSQGNLEQTEHPLDVALQGDGFFVVAGPHGPLYTRNGVFRLDADGNLVTADHRAVQGSSGDITIPQDAPFASIQIGKDGTVFANGVQAGQLKIVRFESPHQLTPAGVTLFAAPLGVNPLAADATVLQGMRERSNVSPIQEMVDLIGAQRRHEAAQRSMSLINESLEKHINVQEGL
jgi:flagellar basal body rod protein FlgG